MLAQKTFSIKRANKAFALYDINSTALVDINKNLKIHLELGVLEHSIGVAKKGTSKTAANVVKWNYSNSNVLNQINIDNSGKFIANINTKYDVNCQAIQITLYKGGDIVDTFTLPIKLESATVFDVNTKLNQITSTIQGNTQKVNVLDGKVKQNTNKLTKVEQTANGLQTTVTSHTTTINQLNGKVATTEKSISTLTQTSNELKSQVKGIKGVNVLSGTGTGVGWSGHKYINEQPAFQFDHQLVSPIFANVSGKYTVSFDKFTGEDPSKIRLKIYQYDNSPLDTNYTFPIEESFKIKDVQVSTLPINQELNRYYLTFNETKGSAKTFRLVFETSKPTVYLAQIMVEDGDVIHKFNSTNYVIESQIKQSAEEIELKVGKAGINLRDGQITLNSSNTTINGNLQLKNSQDGFTLYNQKGMPSVEIKSDDIGNTTINSQQVETVVSANCNIDVSNYDRQSNIVDFYPIESLKQTNIIVGKGEAIKFSMFNLTFRHYGQLVKFYNVNVRCDIKLFRADGSFVKVLQSLPLSVNHSNIYFYHNFTDAGEYKLQFQLSGLNLEGRIRNTKGEYINTNANTPYAIWKLDADYTITRTLIDDQCFTKVANNGFFAKLGSKGSVLFDVNGINFKWGSNGVRLSDRGLQYFGYSDSMSSSTYVATKRNIKVIKESETYQSSDSSVFSYFVKNDDDYLVTPFSIRNYSKHIQIVLDQAQEVNGREITIKDVIKGKNTYVFSFKGIIMHDDTSITHKGENLKIDAREHKYIFSSDLNCWLESVL